jgi:hypothetical protein
MYCAHCGENLGPAPPLVCPRCRQSVPPAGPEAAVAFSREIARATERQQDFTVQVLATFILYFLVWPAGVIANLIFLRQAKTYERRFGHPPGGKGCLTAMIYFFLITGALIALLGIARFYLSDAYDYW